MSTRNKLFKYKKNESTIIDIKKSRTKRRFIYVVFKVIKLISIIGKLFSKNTSNKLRDV